MSCICILLSILPARAHDPFTGLHNRGGTPCCSSDGPTGDCKTTRTQMAPSGHLQVWIDERWTPVREAYGGQNWTPNFWIDVPDDKVLPLDDNPLVGAVVCYRPSLGVLCFLPPRGM